MFPKQACYLPVDIPYEHRRSAGGQDSVDLARNNKSFQRRQQGDEMNIRRRQAVAEEFARLVVLKQKAVETFGLGGNAQASGPGATSGHQKYEPAVRLQETRGAQQRFEFMCPAEVSGISDDEPGHQPKLVSRLTTVRGLRHHVVGVRPVGHYQDAAGIDFARQQSLPHTFAEYDIDDGSPQRAVASGHQ